MSIYVYTHPVDVPSLHTNLNNAQTLSSSDTISFKWICNGLLVRPLKMLKPLQSKPEPKTVIHFSSKSNNRMS